MFTYEDICTNKKRILFVTAHPDDSIVFFGALIHRLRKEQKEVFVLLVTNGARGSRENTVSETELAKLRLGEETAALKTLGVEPKNLFCLGYADGEVESNLQLIGQISRYIRQLKVDMVCTHEPSLQYLENYAKDGHFVQHRDHRKVGEAVIDAVYPFSRDRSFFPEHSVDGIEPHTMYDLLLTDEKDCNFDYDYTPDLEIKRQAMSAHKSQFTPEVVEEILNAWKFGEQYLEKFNYVKLLW